MDDILVVVSVAGLFLLRIGIPVVLLVGLGLLIDRWQSKREADIKRKEEVNTVCITDVKAGLSSHRRHEFTPRYETSAAQVPEVPGSDSDDSECVSEEFEEAVPSR